jgi:hypothetical protein
MRELRFNGEAHHILKEGEQVVYGGGRFEVSDERAEVLLSDPLYNVSPALSANPKRSEVDEFLVAAGLEPSDFPNIDAALAALEGNPPEVSQDEGQDNPDPDEETS